MWRSVPPLPTPIAQGDAEEAPLDALPSEDVTAALPAPAEPEEPNEAMEPTASQDALAPEPESDDDAQLGAVANVDTNRCARGRACPLAQAGAERRRGGQEAGQGRRCPRLPNPNRA